MVKFITLTGELTGSARLNMQCGRPELYLRLRTRRSGHIRAFITDGGKVREVTLSGNSGTFENMEVHGLILTDESGNVVSTGSGDMCAKELEDFKIGIRMLINSKNDAKKHPTAHTTNQKDNPLAHQAQPSAKTNQLPNASPGKSFKQNIGGQSPIKPAAKTSSIQPNIMQPNQSVPYPGNFEKPRQQAAGTHGTKNQQTSNIASIAEQLTHEAFEKPKSPATAEILNKAGYLFHGERLQADEQISQHKQDTTIESNVSNSPLHAGEIKTEECAGCKKETMPPMREAVENPFPNFFDNSYWWRSEGDTKHIHGIANVRGIKYNVTAVRSNAKYPPNGIGRSVRRMYSSDGKRFWVGITKI